MQKYCLTREKIDKIAAYVGFAIKSGAFVPGVDNIKASNGIKLVIADATLSDNSFRRVSRYAEERGIPLALSDNLAEICRKDAVKAAGIKNADLAAAILKTFESN